MDIFVILIAPAVTIVAVLMAARQPVSERQRATLLITTGVGVIMLGVAAMLASDRVAFGAIGLVGILFIALGARRLRAAT